jgi:trigger factor
MKVTQEKLDRSRIGLHIEVTADQTTKYYEKAIKDVTTSVNIPGFRKGKIPRQVILQRVGGTQLKAMAIEALVEAVLPAAAKQESVPAIGNYQLSSEFDRLIEVFNPGQSFQFSGTVDVPAEPKLLTYTGLEVKAEEVVYQPEKVDQFLEEQQRQNATIVPVEGRVAQLEDIAVVDYQGTLADGTSINGAKADDYEMELTEGRFIADLVNGIVGMSIGENKQISVKFPSDYPREDLADAPATFDVTLKDLKAKELPAIDDDFAQEISDFDSLSEFRLDLEKRFKEQAEKATTNNVRDAILSALTDVVEVDLPETTIDAEVLNILNQMAQQFSQYGMDVNKLFTKETIPKMKENCRPDAIDNIKRDMAVEQIAKTEGIVVTPEDLNARIDELKVQLAGESLDPDLLQKFVGKELAQEKTLDWLREKVKVELVPEGTLETDEDEDEELPAESE